MKSLFACLRFATAAAVLAVAICTLPLRAQIYTGLISGVLVDQSGATVPDAAATLTDAKTGRQRQVTTGSTGVFVFPGLEPGEYSVTIEKTGFAKVERKKIVLSAGERLGLGMIELPVGTVGQVLSVEATAAAVKTESSERSGTISSQQVNNLLVMGRSVPALVQLMPGVVMNTNSDSLTRDTTFSSQGGRVNSNNVSVDGINSSDVRNGFSLKLQISQEAVSEVQILLTNYQAEHGQKSGAVVNMVTKSGTRDFHGLFSYFKRHEQFNAMNFFDNRNRITAKPRYRYNTYTWNIGGPVYIPGKWNAGKNKLFFFWNQEFWPVKSSVSLSRTVPAAAERRGDFSQSVFENGRPIVVTDPQNNGQPFPGGIIPSNRLDASGLALLKLFPEANFFDRTVSRGAYNWVSTAETAQPNRTDTVKIDYNLSAKNQISGTYSAFHEVMDGYVYPGYFTGNWSQMPGKFVGANKGATARHTRVVSASVVNEFKFAWFQNPEDWKTTPEMLARNQRKGAGFTAGQLFPGANPEGIVPRATFGGVTNAADLRINGRFPITDPYNLYTWDEKLSIVRGAHIIKLGAFLSWASHGIDPGAERFGFFDFANSANNPLATGYAYSNAALGVYNSYTEASAKPYLDARALMADWYAQDTWKVTPRFVLDYGMRFYWVRPTIETGNRIAAFLPSRFNPAKRAQLIRPGLDASRRQVGVDPISGAVHPAAAIGAIVPGSGEPFNGMVSPSTSTSVPRGLHQNQGVQLAPRIGFSWDPFGGGKTALRGGFGIFFNPLVDEQIMNMVTQPPIVTNPVLYYGHISTVASSQGYLFPSAVRGWDPLDHMASAINYSLSVQRNVGFNTIVDVAYVASLGRHLSWARNLNAVPYGANFAPANQDPARPGTPLPVNFLRPYFGLGNITYRESAGTSNYHSLQITANRRFTRGLEFGASYTWSKALDFVTGDFATVSILIPARKRDYGLSTLDRTHILKVNWLASLPKTRWSNPAARAVLNNWQVLGIASFNSGPPAGAGFTTTVPIDITGSPTDGARIDVIGNPNLPKSGKTFSRNFRAEAFALPAVGTIGTQGKTSIRLPGVNNWDIAIFRNLPIREGVGIQIRWEMYNAFNHTQFSGLNVTARFAPSGEQLNPGFGEYTSAAAPRRMQFAARFNF